MHGLVAGRAAKAWVIVSYVVCVLLVLVGLAVRLSVSLNRNKDFSSTAGRRDQAGRHAGADQPPPADDSDRRADERGREPAGADPALGAGRAGSPRPQPRRPARSRPPAVACRRADEDGRPRAPAPGGRGRVDGRPAARRPDGRRRSSYEEPGPRGRREDYPGRGARPRPRASPNGTGALVRGHRARLRRPDDGRHRRPDAPPDLEDTGTRLRRAELDGHGRPGCAGPRWTTPARSGPSSTSPAPRHAAATTRNPRRAPGSWPRRAELRRRPAAAAAHADDDYEELPRRARALRGGSATARPSSARYEEEADAPRARRADPGRHSRSEFVDLADRPNYRPDETPTLVDMASRRAPGRPAGTGPQSGGAGGPARRGRGRMTTT